MSYNARPRCARTRAVSTSQLPWLWPVLAAVLLCFTAFPARGLPPQIADLDQGSSAPSGLLGAAAAEDVSAVYFETFESCIDWTPVDLTPTLGVKWHTTTHDHGDGQGIRGVFWCGESNPLFGGGSGYGNNWDQVLTKSLALGTAPVSATLTHQYDTEAGFDFCRFEVSTDAGATYTELIRYDGSSGGFVADVVDLSAYAGQNVVLRLRFTSDNAWSDEDTGSFGFQTDGAWRVDAIQVSGFAADDFETGADGWLAEENFVPMATGSYRLEGSPPCAGGLDCPDYCSSWAAYDPSTGVVGFMTPEMLGTGRASQYGIESPWIHIPADADSLFLVFDVFHDSDTPSDGDFNAITFDWRLLYEDPGSGSLVSVTGPFVYYRTNGWSEFRTRIDDHLPAGVNRIRIQLTLFDFQPFLAANGLTWTGVHGSGPYFDNVRILAPGTSQPTFDITGLPRDCSATAACLGPSDPSCDGTAAGDEFAYYPGEGDGDNILGGHDLTAVNGAGFDAGFIGSAFDLPGAGQYFRDNDSSPYLNSAAGTFSAWIRRDEIVIPQPGAQNGHQPVMGKHEDSHAGWQLYILDDGLLGTSYNKAAGGGYETWRTVRVDLPWNLDQWYHVAGTRGPEGIKLYRDGVLVAHDPTLTDPFVEYGNGYFNIGALANNGPQWPETFRGDIDDARVWLRQLSDAEVAELYIEGSTFAGTCPASATTFTLVDQFDDPIPGSQFLVNPGPSQILLDNGDSVQLDAGTYTVRFYPGIAGLVDTRAPYRTESVTVTTGGAVQFIWETADITITVVDQFGDPIPGSHWGMGGQSGFPGGLNGASATVPVTEDPTYVYGGTWAGGYQFGIRPGIGGLVAANAPSRNEILEAPTGGASYTFEWVTASLAINVLDQFGDPIPGSTWVLAGQSGLPGGATGAPVTVPVTEHPDYVIGGTWGTGYLGQVYPGINGDPASGNYLTRQLYNVEVSPGSNILNIPWEVASGTLFVVDAAETDVAGTVSEFTGGLFSFTSGDEVWLPVTEDTPANANIGSITGPLASGYNVRFTVPGAPTSAFQFELNPGEVWDPLFVTISGAQYGLRFNLAVDVAGVVSSDCDGALSGIEVTLVDGEGTTHVTTTAADGSYLFDDVPRTGIDGALSIAVPAGYTLISSQGSPLPMTGDQTVDFALECVYVTVSGTVASDCDSALDGVDVALTDGEGLNLNTTTAAGGSYSFPGIRYSTASATVSIAVPDGYVAGAPAGGTASVVLTDDQTAVFSLECLYVTVSGAVSACNGSLQGVTVDLDLDPLNPGADMLITATDASGAYSFSGIRWSTVDAEVTVVVPLGYEAVTPADGHALVSLEADANLDFSLGCLTPDGEARSIGYWKHQANVYLKNKGNAQESEADMETTFPNAVFNHFYENQLNSIEVAGVTYMDDGSGGNIPLDLAAIHATLSVKGNAGMIAKAKQQYLAFLLNIASGKLQTTSVISDDGGTASQALQQVADYINDGDSSNDETAKDICDVINNAQLVPAGVIDLGISEIAYRSGLGPVTALRGALPNPFLGATTVNFAMVESGPARVEIYDTAGRRIRVLVDEVVAAGEHHLVWDGRDDSGRNTAAGVYFVHMRTGDFRATQRAVRVR